MHSDAWAPVIPGHVDVQLHVAAVATATVKDTFSKGPWEPQEGWCPLPTLAVGSLRPAVLADVITGELWDKFKLVMQQCLEIGSW